MVKLMALSGAILAGGKSLRMGQDKALLPFRGKPLLQHVADLLRPHVREVVIAGGKPEYAVWGRLVPDLLSPPCPLAGLHAALSGITTPRAFIVACDMPFIDIARLREWEGIEADVVVPVSSQGMEPLHAMYARSCLPALERRLREGRPKITDFYDLVKVREVRVDDITAFRNLNTPEDYSRATEK